MNATPPHIARVPRIAITPGEPAGIGPDLCVTLAQRAHGAELVAVADPVLLMQRAAELHLPLALLPFDRAQAPQPQAAGTLRVAPVRCARRHVRVYSMPPMRRTCSIRCGAGPRAVSTRSSTPW